MIVDPWGKVIAELGGEGQDAEIAVANIDLAMVDKIKREMPLLRRTLVPLQALLPLDLSDFS